ncbi:MAG: extracellular solute-binding protein [Geminicoccaceae bacterium]|nr:extracellular solute-binding protein [Geminicoccaceae bacterium]
MIERLVVRFGRTTVLENLDLAVAEGELVALLGASGCGKTTLLRAVAGFAPVQRGRIAVGGVEIQHLPPERREAALVFQSYALWPHMTAARNIGYGLEVRRRPRAEIRARVDEMLRMLGLEGLGERNVTQLSGGQRQRVALGRALAIEPRRRLLDEPRSNLGARIRHELRHEIRAIQRRLGITALHVTHDREEAMVMADRIAVMDQGRIVQLDTPEGLWHRPASPFVAAFMGADNRLELEVVRTEQGLRVRCHEPPAEAVLPVGEQGPHLAGRPTSRMTAQFRSSAARLVAPDARLAGTLVLSGRIEQAAYLGDLWRHTVRIGPVALLVDHPAQLRPGEAAGVAVPAAALHLFPETGAPAAAETTDPEAGAPPATDLTEEEDRTMRTPTLDRRAALGAVALGALVLAAPAGAQTVLNVVTAGDQNMVDYVNDFLGPRFEKLVPGVRVRAAGTGPGDAGSQKIYEKLAAQAQAGVAAWDVDVAVVHQRMAGQMVKENLLARYREEVATGKLVTRETAENALGQPVGGYVLPMFHSQIALAYNPALVPNPPRTYAELAEWVKKNPKQFGYNGIKGGMSGVGFVMGWVTAHSGLADKLEKGPYDPALKAEIEKALAGLKEFNRSVTLTPGNAGTLDALNRGEIAMGPVWVDMFYTWQADGRLNPSLKLALLGPGLPGQPMYYVLPAKAANAELAKKFIEFATSPEIQAEGIVKRFNWYPGIDAEHVRAKLDEASWNKLFTDIKPEDLATKGRPFPLTQYFSDILEAYERTVAN